MTAVAQKTVLTGCLAPIDKDGLEQLIVNGKANPKVIKTLKCKTVAEGKFRHANYIRNLAPYIVDEPPGLLGDDTAPNPSEASLAALGSCLAVGLHANAVHRGWIVNKLELELEGDLNITAVWGTGDVSEKPVGFTDVRVKVDMECEGVPKSEIDALVTHVKKWSPVANTFTRPVNLEVSVVTATRRKAIGVRRVSWVHWRYPGSKLQIGPHLDRRPGCSDCAQGTRTPGAGDRRRHALSGCVAARLGEVGAWGSHRTAGMARPICAAPFSRSPRIGEVCGATAFMAWCQNTLVWYAANSDNPEARRQIRFGDSLPADEILGGTGLSNPMKSFFGIEKLKLKGRKVEGGYVVRGALPWVSNLGPDHFFGTIFEREDEPAAPQRRAGHRDVPRRLLQSRDHAAAVQAVPRHGRHRHLWRAVPRRLRAG